MTTLNEPDYDAIKVRVVRCLKAWMPNYSPKDEEVAFKRLDEIWPDVQWTNWKFVIKATRDAAQYAIDQAKIAPPVPGKRKPGRAPKSNVVLEEKEEVVELETAKVDESITIE